MRNIILLVAISLMTVMPVMAQDEPGLLAGQMAPDFTAMTVTGEEARLSKINEQGPVILIFYRGGWCIYCNRQLQALQQNLEEFKNLGASIIAVSVDLRDQAAKTVEKFQLGFTVISDPQAKLLEDYNLIYQVPDDLAKKYKEEYNIDLERASGRSDHVIAVPAAFIIDRAGMIAYAYANPDYKVRKSPEELLTILKAIEQ